MALDSVTGATMVTSPRGRRAKARAWIPGDCTPSSLVTRMLGIGAFQYSPTGRRDGCADGAHGTDQAGKAHLWARCVGSAFDSSCRCIGPGAYPMAWRIQLPATRRLRRHLRPACVG